MNRIFLIQLAAPSSSSSIDVDKVRDMQPLTAARLLPTGMHKK